MGRGWFIVYVDTSVYLCLNVWLGSYAAGTWASLVFKSFIKSNVLEQPVLAESSEDPVGSTVNKCRWLTTTEFRGVADRV